MAASLMLAVRAIYSESVPFKASYILMSIVLVCTTFFYILAYQMELNRFS